MGVSRADAQHQAHSAAAQPAPEYDDAPRATAVEDKPSPHSEMRAPYRAIVEQAPDAVVVVDGAGCIELVNRRTEELFGYARAELLHQPVEMLVPERFRAAHRGERARYESAPYVRPMGSGLRLRGQRRDGTEFPAEINLSPLDEGGGVIATVRDIGEQERVRAAQEAADRASDRLRRLQAVTDTALAHLDVDDLLSALLDRVCEVEAVDLATVLLLADHEPELRVRAVRGPKARVAAAVPIPMGQGVAGRVAASREPLIIEDLSAFPVIPGSVFERQRSAMGVPLLRGERLLGVLAVSTDERRSFTEQDVQLLQRVAERMAVAIERSQLYAAERQARARADARSAELEAVLGGMTDAVAVLDSEGHITYVNATYREMFALDAQSDFTSLSSAERTALFHARTVSGEPIPMDQYAGTRLLHGEVLSGANSPDYILDALDGRAVTVQVAGSPLRDATGAITGAVLVMRDVTEVRRLERALAEQAEQLERIVEAMAEGLFVYDTQGRVLRTNAAARRLLGGDASTADIFERPAEERLALYALRGPDGRPLAPAEWPVVRALHGGDPLRGPETWDFTMRTVDGREVEVSASIAPLRAPDGQLTGSVMLLNDRTERNRLQRERRLALEASETWFRTLADTAPVLVWVSGLDGLVTFVNQPWLQYTGRSLEHEVGNGWADGVHPDDVEHCLQTYRTAFQARKPFTMEYRLRRADGEYRWLLDTGVPREAPDGTFAGYIGSCIDITERHELEQARATELALREINERLDTFVSTAAHDLRHPVAVSKMRVQMAQRRVLQAAAEAHGATAKQTLPFIQVGQALQATERDLDRLWRLMQQLLDVTRARQGTLVLDRQPCDLVALVRAAVDEQRMVTPERTLTLDLPGFAGEEELTINADADRLSQVLNNYLSNAVRYSPDDQPIAVTLRVLDQAPDQAPEGAGGRVARVAVRDRGPGIAPAEQAAIWGRFQRARSAREATGGLGLGLYIARTIVELHGGQVGVDSTVGEGATFWFTIPLDPSAG